MIENKNEWVGMLGDIISSSNYFIYKGKTEKLIDQVTMTETDEEIPSVGIFINKNQLFQGRISADVEITKQPRLLNYGTTLQILFNFSNENGVMKYNFIGINTVGKGPCGFSYVEFNGRDFNTRDLFGSISYIKPNKTINLCLEISGSKIIFFVDNVRMYSTNLLEPITSNLVGLFCRSDVDLIIKNYSVKATKQKAFVIMKYDNMFNDLYQEVIKPVCNEFEYDVTRADENYSTGMIIEDIVNQISESSLIIADITPDNPNVFYELGYAHALKKPTILLTERSQRGQLPFDVSGFRVIFYDNSIAGKSEVENRLRQFLGNIKLNK